MAQACLPATHNGKWTIQGHQLAGINSFFNHLMQQIEWWYEIWTTNSNTQIKLKTKPVATLELLRALHVYLNTLTKFGGGGGGERG